MKKLLCLALCAVLPTAYAGEKEIRESLKNFPAIEAIDEVNKTPYAGLYEVVVDKNIIYTDEQGAFLFQGGIIEADTRRNITQQRLQKIRAIKFEDLPLELATKKVTGTGEKVLVQFTDPNCGFCRKLEREVFPNIENMTLYSFLVSFQPGAEKVVNHVLCAQNPVQAWDDLMLNGKKPAEQSCDNDALKIQELAAKLGVRATPTLVFQDGAIQPGYLPTPALEQRFEQQKKTVE